jgi:hypothetical protein
MQKNVIIAVVVLAAIIVVAVILGGFYMQSNPVNNSGLIGMPVGAAQLAQLKMIALNSSLASSVGLGSATNGGHPNYPKTVSGAAPIVVEGKAGVLFVSADYCPFCAVTRWGLIIALMRFGNFTGLDYMTSTPNDSYPSSPTFTFSNSSYYSSSIYFDAVETATINGKPLEKPDALQNATIFKYDPGSPTPIPFTDFGNVSVLVGAAVSPQVLQDKTWNQIIAQLNDTSTPVSQAVIGSANLFTAYICRIDPNVNQTSACQQAYVKSLNKQLPA